MTASLVTLGDENFVSLTTFRRSGEPVSTPVWTVRDGDALVVQTGADTGKVKRLRHHPRAQLRACDRRGRVLDGTPTVEVEAVVDDSPEAVRDVEGLLKAKYGWELGVIRLVRGVQRRLGRGPAPGDHAVLRLTHA